MQEEDRRRVTVAAQHKYAPVIERPDALPARFPALYSRSQRHRRLQPIESPAGHELSVHSGDVRIAALRAGDPTGPTVVLVHGYPDTKEFWTPVMSRLATRFHVIAYDVRGAGASSAPVETAAYGYRCLGNDLE